jgi:YVTN family beta-propeller protein
VETTTNGADGTQSAGREGERQPIAGAEIRTFLIADVRGYTRFTQERGDDAAAGLARAFAEHSREVIEACGGELIELRGDEALSVFGSARQAIRAAVELQTRFRSSDVGFPLGIGVGLDAGEAVPVAGGFRGGALNVAARLCSIAGPGEILATDTVTSLARYIEGIRVKERRAVRLKGLERPVRLSEVSTVAPLPPVPTVPSRRRYGWKSVAALALLGAAVVAASVATYALRSDESGLPRLAENTVGLVDPESNRLVAEVPFGSPIDAIAAGAGALWVSNATDGTVSRIDPETFDVRTIDVGGRPAGLAFAGGSLWVANSEARRVTQIDVESAKVVQSVPVGNGPRAVAVGFGSVWVANSSDGTVSKIDLERPDEPQVVSVGGTPVALAVSRDSVWVASETSGVVTRISGASGDVVTPITVGTGSTAVAVGAGAVWVANRQDATVSRIDPATNTPTAAVPVGARPVALAVADGSVWVAESGAGTLSRIDADAGHVEDTLTVTASPAGLALLGDDLWTTALAPLDSHRGGTLRVQSPPLDSVDPRVAFSLESFRVVGLAYDGLVAYRRAGGAAGATLVANLATHIPAPTEGGKTYTFQLRPGIRYSDGSPVRPEDFRSSVERTFGSTEFPLALFAGVVGGAACLETTDACDLSRGIETSDDARTVTIHLTAPDPSFLFKLALPLASLVPAGSSVAAGNDQPPPGTGPYKIETADRGATLRLVRNAYFRVWASDARPDGYPDQILLETGLPDNRRTEAVLDGEADWADVPPERPERARALATVRPAQLRSDPLLATWYMFLNVHVRPFDDPRVRRAVNLATDRAHLVDLLGGPLNAQPTCQIVPPNIFGYRPHCPYTVDPDPAGTWIAPDIARASQLIDASGTRGTNVEVLAFSALEPVGRYFASLLRRLGYDASVRVLEDEKYFATVSDSLTDAQIGPIVWLADFPAAPNFVELFSCASFFPAAPFTNTNYSGLCDRRVDAAIAAAKEAQARDPLAGGELWATADRAVTDTAAAVPFANLRSATLVSERVGNYQYHPLWGTLLDQLWVR